MLENSLIIKKVDLRTRITYKAIVSAGLIALAVTLPQIVHLAIGQPGGVKWLPMYLPVLIGGCLLGAKWGLVVGMLSPIVSFLITSALGEAMPAAARLPFMVFELAVFAVVSGLFTKKISENGLWAIAAVISAAIAGRLLFLGAVAVFSAFTPFTVQMIWGQIITGLPGLAVQCVVVPFVLIGLKKLMIKDQEND